MAFSVVGSRLPVCSLLLRHPKAINQLQNSFTPNALHDHSPFRNKSVHDIVSDPLTVRNTSGSNKLLAKYVKASSLKTTATAINAEEMAEPAEGRFSQSLWDDALFTPDYEIEETYARDVQKLKEQARGMILDKERDSSDKMILIDLIERLGLGHHYKKEIEDQIENIYEFQSENKDTECDLFTTALQFRLFRQHGIDAPSNIFHKFMDEASSAFKEIHSKDIKGLLSFYEATHLRYQGEDILKEGSAFASHHLKQAIPQLDSHLQERVTRALRQPAHWGNPRIEAHSYISFYNKEKMKNELVLKFAKLDFNLVQNLYKHEISMLLRWWKRLNIQSKLLPYIRNRMVEVYFWAMTVASEPQLSFARVSAAKGLMLYVVMNDTADGYGDLEDVTTFFNILQQRLDVEHVDRLPDGLRIACKAILNTFEELDHVISRQGRPYAVPCAREALKNLATCYLRTAIWYKGVVTPTFRETISYADDDSGCIAVAAACLMSMESASEEAMEWLLSASTIARASGLYVRCTNNIASYEKEDDLQGTAIDCYMKEHQATKEEAVAKLHELAEDALMTINKEWVSTKHVPKDIMCRPVNYARAAYVSYLGGFDGFTDPKTVNVLKNEMEAVFIHPVTID